MLFVCHACAMRAFHEGDFEELSLGGFGPGHCEVCFAKTAREGGHYVTGVFADQIARVNFAWLASAVEGVCRNCMNRIRETLLSIELDDLAKHCTPYGMVWESCTASMKDAARESAKRMRHRLFAALGEVS